MFNVSSAYREILADPTIVREYRLLITIYGVTNTVLTEADLVAGSLHYQEISSDGKELSLGSACMSSIEFTLLNLTGALDSLHLMDSLIRVQVGLVAGSVVQTWGRIVSKNASWADIDVSWQSLENGNFPAVYDTEWVDMGYFIIVAAPAGRKTIPVKAYDRMVLTERAYFKAGVTFPCTPQAALDKITALCGITAFTLTGTNTSMTLKGLPDGNRMTCRDAIGHLAALFGKIARFNRAGILEFIWYGGESVATIEPRHRDKLELTATPIALTGLEYVDVDEANSQKTYRAGADDYCLQMSENPFMTGQNIQTIVNAIWADIGATPYYIYECVMQGDPAYQSGDTITIVMADGTSRQTIIMSHDYTFRSRSILKSDGKATVLTEYKPAGEKNLSAIAAAEKATSQQLSNYQQSQIQLGELMAQSMGLHPTVVTQADGSVIYYFHDGPTLETSTYIWRQDALTHTVSSDGGQTWHGMDAMGNMIVRVLNAVGIIANWIQAGELRSATGRILLDLDAETFTLGSHVLDILSGALKFTSNQREEVLDYEFKRSGGDKANVKIDGTLEVTEGVSWGKGRIEKHTETGNSGIVIVF